MTVIFSFLCCSQVLQKGKRVSKENLKLHEEEMCTAYELDHDRKKQLEK